MNILILTRYNNDGGVVTHVINLANELTYRGNTVVVAAPYDSKGLKGRYDRLECVFIPVDFEGKNFVRIIKLLSGIIKKYGIQIIHSHNRNTSLYAQFFRLSQGIPFVWTLHQNNIPTRFPYKFLTFPGDRTIAVSNELKEFCVEKLGVAKNRISIIYNGVHEREYIRDIENSGIKRKYGIKPNETVIVLLSRLERRKGHMMLLNALSRIKEKNMMRVLITGTDLDDGEYRSELQHFIKDKELENIISFVGYVNPVEILNISDAMVLPSEQEGQPIAVTEAFLMKVPVIRTKTGGYEETKDYCIGINDEEELAAAIKRVLSEKNGLEQVVNGAYCFAVKNCTVSTMVLNTVTVYNTVLRLRK